MSARPLLVRADATAAIGTGHVMRCLTLAAAWRQATGGGCHLATAAPLAGVGGRLRAAGVPVRQLAVSGGGGRDLTSRAGEDDADATVEAARAIGAAWIVLDGYGFDLPYQRRLAAAGVPVLVLDDHGHADGYRADLLLNQNFGAAPGPYAGVPADRLLLGPRYALVRDEFSQLTAATVGPIVRRVLVTLGGSDPDDVTSLVVAGLAQAALDAEITVVAGAANRHVDRLAAQVGALPRAGLVVDAHDLARRMADSDMAIAAAGGTARELALLGVPALVVTLAENQRPAAEAMGRMGVAVDLGWGHELSAERVAAEVTALAADADRRAALARRGREAVDGRGATRVVEAMRGVGRLAA